MVGVLLLNYIDMILCGIMTFLSLQIYNMLQVFRSSFPILAYLNDLIRIHDMYKIYDDKKLSKLYSDKQAEEKGLSGG